MAYAQTTLGSARTLLAARLSDTALRFYTSPELDSALRESLRLWNLLTSHDRARGYFRTSASVAFYSLPSVLNTAADGSGEYLRAQTLLDTDLLDEITFHLCEDVMPTDMFTAAQIAAALNDARNQFLADSYTVLARRTDTVSFGADTVDFPGTVTSVRRAVWRASDNRVTTLSRSDERTATGYNRSWSTASTPRAYSLAASAPLRLRIIPPPPETGTLETLVIDTGTPLDGSGVALGVPDDLAWAVKYRALATLFSADGPAADPQRAARALALYNLGVVAATALATVLHAEIDGRPVLPSALHRTDRFRAGWEGRTPTTPDMLSIAAPDLVALTPLPDGPHSVALDVVRNTVVPPTSAAYLQLGSEHLGAVLDLAQWICLFKVGGAELEAAEPLMSNFLAAARTFAHQRSALSTALASMLELGASNTTAYAPENDPSESLRNADEVRQERNARRRKVLAR